MTRKHARRERRPRASNRRWCRLANTLWCAANARRERHFQHALQNPLRAQREILGRMLARQQSSEFGKEHRFDPNWTVVDFQRNVPLRQYAEFEPWIDRITRGAAHVLTVDRVSHLIPTSGTSGAHKLIPYTAGLQQQFNAALGPWIRSLYRAQPTLRQGPAYWSVSPAIPEDNTSAIRIGFDDDTAYLGRWSQWWVQQTLAVPNDVRHLTDFTQFQFATLQHLVAARDLRLISVWHPSFLTLLLDALPDHWDQILAVLPIPRVRSLGKIAPTDLAGIWPDLKLISAWGDAAATLPFGKLRRAWPWITFQPKGLIASECWTTIPYRDQYPLAVTSHFFEFLDATGDVHLPDALIVGRDYETVVTTAGGLYRYRTGDVVRVTGQLNATPTLRFIGRQSGVSDLCGEKLHETHVTEALLKAYRSHGMSVADHRLGPASESAPTHYVLLIASEQDLPVGLAAALDQQLRLNPHYDWCRRLGQLRQLEVKRLDPSKHPDGFAPPPTVTNTPLGGQKPCVFMTPHRMASILTAL